MIHTETTNTDSSIRGGFSAPFMTEQSPNLQNAVTGLRKYTPSVKTFEKSNHNSIGAVI